tara:strand:- start:1188 stop:1370 length:183 start_codon:yes stop_codon:yes gene_type:complete
MTQENKLLKRVTIEYYENLSGRLPSSVDAVRIINKKITTEDFNVKSSKGNPVISYTSEMI